MEKHKVGFIYTVELLDRHKRIVERIEVENIVPTVGLNYLVGSSLLGASQFSAWYLGLFDNNFSPGASDTMTTLIAGCGENKDYTGATRQAITFPAVSVGAVSTAADPNIFAFATAETIRGAFITTTAAWESTTGLLLSAVLFPSPKVVEAGGYLRVPVGFGLVSV